MRGPLPTGTFGDVPRPSFSNEGGLARGVQYRVTKPFVDSDGDLHPNGEEWLFVASMFSAYDELLLIGVRSLTGEEWEFHLSANASEQHHVMDNFLQYVTPVST